MTYTKNLTKEVVPKKKRKIMENTEDKPNFDILDPNWVAKLDVPIKPTDKKVKSGNPTLDKIMAGGIPKLENEE